MRYSDQKRIGGRATATLGCFLIVTSLLAGCATTVIPDSASKSEPYLEMAPNKVESPNAKTLYAMARLLILREKQDQGEIILVRLVNEYPEFAPAYCDLAELLLQQGRIDEAKTALQKGLDTFPNDHILINDLGVCYLLSSDYERALEMFEEATNLRPQEARYQANKALALALLGRNDEAQGLYTRVLGSETAQFNMKAVDDFLGSNE